MSAGTPLKALRIPPKLAKEIDRTIERRNYHSKREPWNFTGFCLTVIAREIAKMARSGKRPRVDVAALLRRESDDSEAASTNHHTGG